METNAKMLERVRALLAKADSTTFEAEAESFRVKADELMTRFAIEQWQVQEAQAGQTERPKPEVRHMSFGWFRESKRSSELWSLFTNVADHCRCVVAVRGYGTDGYQTIPVIGLSSDLDYFDMLFTHLMLQMGKGLEPEVNPRTGLGENAYLMRAAGMSRDRLSELLFRANLVGRTEETDWSQLSDQRRSTLRRSVRKASQDYEQRCGLHVKNISPEVFQRSYATGFVTEVGNRLRAMAASASANSGDGASMALAIRDIRQQAVDLYRELWPAPEASKGKAKGRAIQRSVRLDGSALSAGRVAGSRADIAGSTGRRVGQTRELR